MTAVTVDLSEVEAFARTVREQPDKIGEQLEAIMAKTLTDTVAHAQARVPVDTGFLKGSIGADLAGGGLTWTGDVGPTADYGAYVEFGTWKMAPQPYMIPAQVAVEPGFVAAAEAVIARVL